MALTGRETLQVLGQDLSGSPAATTETTTTGAIAALASSDTSFTSTAVTNTTGTTLTAAALTGGQIVRTGPTAAFSDTTDTAANIVAVPGVVVGGSFSILLKNATAFPQTILAGLGVTLPATVVVPPFSVLNYIAQVVSATAVTFVHIDTTSISTGQVYTSPTETALTTVGNGTITAAGIAGGLTGRSGATTAFTDTTDIASSIISTATNLVNKIGTAMMYRYVNNTVAVATIQGGTGVTVSGVTVVPANSWAEYLVTYTATATITMVGVAQGYFPSFGTYINNGATPVTVANAAVTVGSIISFTLKTVGGTVSAGAPNVKTITPGTGFTVAGVASDTSTYNYEIRG